MYQPSRSTYLQRWTCKLSPPSSRPIKAMCFVHPVYKSCLVIRRRTDSLTFLRLTSPAFIVRIILLNNLYNLIMIKLKNNPKISTESVKRGDANPRLSSFSRSNPFRRKLIKEFRRILNCSNLSKIFCSTNS